MPDHTNIEPRLRAAAAADLERAYARVVQTGTGEVVFCDGMAGAGKTTLLAAFLSGLSRHTDRPIVFAGGFDRRQPGVLRAWHLGDLRVDLLRQAGNAVTGLGQLASTVGAAAAVAGPAAATAVATSLAGLVGQAAQAGGFAALLVAGQPGAPATPPSAAEVFQAISGACDGRRPVVLVLDDLDVATPAVEWRGLLLERWLGPLAAHQPLLVVAAATTDHTNNLSALNVRGARTATVVLRHVTTADVEAWLELVAPEVVADLVACGGGHPGWTVRLMRDWVAKGIVARAAADGTWRYTAAHDRAAAIPTAKATVSALLWKLLDPDLDAYDRAERLLTVAAIEGSEFTADAVAAVLGENRDDLVVWLEDYLVAGTARPSAPLLKAGFVPGAGRPLVRYGFRSPLLWSTFADGPLPTGVTEFAYAQALADAYGGSGAAPAALIARLLREAGQHYAALHYQHRADLQADHAVHQAILEAEVDAIEQRGQETPSTPAEALATATRIVISCVALQTAMHPGQLMNLLLFSYNVCEELDQAEPTLDTAVLRAHVCTVLARVAYGQEWFADAVALSDSARRLWAEFGDDEAAVGVATTTIGACGRMLSGLDGGVLAGMTTRQIPLDLASPLLAGSSSGWGTRDEIVRSLVTLADDRAGDIASALDGMQGKGVPHLRGELCMARMDVAAGCDDFPAAMELLDEAAEHFSTCVHGELCPRRGEALARMVSVMFLMDDNAASRAMADQALYVLIADGAWMRIVNVQSYISHCEARLGRLAAAVAAAAHGIYVAKMAGIKPLEGWMWEILAEKAGRIAGGEGASRRCLAMAAVTASVRREEVVTRLQVEIGDDEAADRLIVLAERAFADDEGAALLQEVAGVTFEDTKRYLAACANRATELA